MVMYICLFVEISPVQELTKQYLVELLKQIPLHDWILDATREPFYLREYYVEPAFVWQTKGTRRYRARSEKSVFEITLLANANAGERPKSILIEGKENCSTTY